MLEIKGNTTELGSKPKPQEWGGGTGLGLLRGGTPVQSPPTHNPILREYRIRVYDGYVEIDSPLRADLRGYIVFREDIAAADKAILKEVYGVQCSKSV